MSRETSSAARGAVTPSVVTRPASTVRHEPTAMPATAAITTSAQAGTGPGIGMAFGDPFWGSRALGRGTAVHAIRVFPVGCGIAG